MASLQRGQTVKRGKRWAARWYDEAGNRQFEGGFETKTAAREWVDSKVEGVSALRRGDPVAVRRRELPTFGELVDEFFAQHNAEENTIATLKFRLRYVTEGPELDGRGGWKDLRVDRLQVGEVGAWRKRLPAGSAWHVHKALRQLLGYALAAKLLDENVAKLTPNPEPKRREVVAFETVAELEAIGAELSPTFSALPVLVGLTGLRPEEWLALERGDVDRRGGVVHVRRVYTDGRVKLYGKSERSLRAVPLPARAAEALDELPVRLDTRLIFPGEQGGHLNLHNWRREEWTPAVKAAGLEHRSPYALRHTFATFAIAAGVGLFEVARFMGTSVEQIDRTYGHLLPDSRERARAALDALVAAEEAREAVQ